jgi:16S rRNA (guanine1516-N2)-methyltransferase
MPGFPVTPQKPRIEVRPLEDSAECRARAAQVAHALRDCLTEHAGNGDLVLEVSSDGLGLREAGAAHARAIRVDLHGLARIDPGALRGQPLIRALGSKCHTVIDATAGLGQDSFFMALAGYEVVAVERSPVLASMLEDGFVRAAAEPVLGPRLAGKLQLVVGDATKVLADLPMADAVYIDPMFPPKRRKSALPPKEMQILRRLVGEDEDAVAVFAAAMARARLRVVVKRPNYAPPLVPDPDFSKQGKLVRYDVYLVQNRKSFASGDNAV